MDDTSKDNEEHLSVNIFSNMNGDPKWSVTLDDENADIFNIGSFTNVTLPLKSTHQVESILNIRTLKDREGRIIKDILDVLVGKQGEFIRYNNQIPSDNSTQLTVRKYTIDLGIDINFRDTVIKLSDLGSKVAFIMNFESIYNRNVNGQVIGKLCEVIRNTIRLYHLLIDQLVETTKNDSNFNLISLFHRISHQQMEIVDCSALKCIELIFDIIHTIHIENHKRLQSSNLIDMKFESLMNSLKEDLDSNMLDDIIVDSQSSTQVKGGSVLNIVMKITQQNKSDIQSHTFLKNLYEEISVGYLPIINNWLQHGELSDSFNEFFVVEDTINDVAYNSYYWLNKFAIKREGLLCQLNSTELQKMMFLSGKYMRIIRECNYIVPSTPCAFSPIKSLQDKDVELLVSAAYNTANQNILQMLCVAYELPKFMSLLNKYFLISDGSLFDDFLNLSNHELKRSFTTAAIDDIIKSYESVYKKKSQGRSEQLFLTILAIHFEKQSFLEELLEIVRTKVTDRNDIINARNLGSLTDILKANIHSNQISDQQNGGGKETQRCNRLAISKLNIDIKIPFPLNQLVSESHKLEYQILFRHSALIKFIEKRLEKSWRELGYQTFWTWSFDDIRVRKWIKRCRFIHTKMVDFIRIYLYYSNIDVHESNWSRLEHVLSQFQSGNYNYDLNTMKQQLTEFLSSSMSDLLLSQTNLTTSLYELLTLIMVFHEYVMSVRKALLFLDRSLMDSQRVKHNFTFTYSIQEKEKKLQSLIQVLDSYHLAFQRKLVELSQNLSYYGGVDSPKLLVLEKLLVSAFQL